MASGMPRPSQIKWRLLPRLARSVGLGPVCSPQKPLARNSCQQQHTTSRSRHDAKASSATRNASNPRFQPAANRVAVANKSCRNRNATVSAASARECRFGVRKRCPKGTFGRRDTDGHLVVWASEAAGEIRSIPIRYQARAQQPWWVLGTEDDPVRCYVTEVLLQVLRSGERVQHFETLRSTKEGRVIRVSVSMSPIRNTSGRIVGASTIAREVTT
jgi:hypothetical protein